MRPILFLDKQCAFCQKWGRAIAFGLCGKNKVRIQSLDYLHEDTPIALYMRENDSWALVESNHQYARFDVFVALVSHSPWLKWSTKIWQWSGIHWVGEKVYRFVSKRRFCKVDK